MCNRAHGLGAVFRDESKLLALQSLGYDYIIYLSSSDYHVRNSHFQQKVADVLMFTNIHWLGR